MVAVIFPVHAMQVLVVEFVGYLTQHVLIDIFALKRGPAVVGSLELDVLHIPLGEVHLLHAGACDDEYILPLGIGFDASGDTFYEKLGVAVAEIALK